MEEGEVMPNKHLTLDDILNHIVGETSEETDILLYEHLADCDLCADTVRKARRTAGLLDQLTARHHGEVFRQAQVLRRLTTLAENESDPTRQERLWKWLHEFRGKAAHALRVLFDLPGEATGYSEEGLSDLLIESPSLPYQINCFQPGLSLEYQAARSISQPPLDQPEVSLEPEHHRIVIRFSTRDYSPEKQPIVLLVPDQSDRLPRQGTAALIQGSSYQITFEDVPPGEYLILTEPGGRGG